MISTGASDGKVTKWSLSSTESDDDPQQCPWNMNKKKVVQAHQQAVSVVDFYDGKVDHIVLGWVSKCILSILILLGSTFKLWDMELKEGKKIFSSTGGTVPLGIEC